jgi:SAM-dependent methyltransferase
VRPPGASALPPPHGLAGAEVRMVLSPANSLRATVARAAEQAVPDTPSIDDKYYQVVPKRSLGERLTVLARDRIFDDFLRICRPAPEDAILDVGVSDVINDAANVLERKYPRADRITAVGLGEGSGFRATYAGVAYRQIEPNKPLPFADGAFAIATSNAVLEHVGSPAAQLAFVRDLVRVARKAFITVPHRYFPVEHHTAIPLLHYWDGTFARACAALGKNEWAREENLILMSRRRLAALAPPGTRWTTGNTGIPLGPFSSNLYLFVDRGDGA